MANPTIYTTSERYAQQTNNHNAGYDLYPLKTITINPGCTERVNTGDRVLVGANNAGFIFPRSSSHGKIVANTGVIDGGYKGDIKMSLSNYGTEPVTIRSNQSPAQLVVIPICRDPIVYLPPDDFANINSDNRGEGGFGSTGSTI